MDTHFWLEIVGYIGSVLVAISLMMKSLLRLRIINMVGAVVFVVYGLLIRAYPVALLNGLIAGADVYYLIQMVRQRDFFALLEVEYDSAYLRSFVAYYWDEINEIFPDLDYEPNEEQVNLFVLRNMIPAGLLVLAPEDDHARVMLDYVIPGYRDFGVAKFIFEDNAAYFRQKGIQRLVSVAGRPRHEEYLKRMGFRLEDGNYVHELRGDV
jgi:GNAT superfamily N-acetyltransferase